MIKKSILILSLSMMVLSGCSQKNNATKDDAPTTENTQNASQATENNKEENKEEETPQSGGTLKMSMRIPKTLNPLVNDDVTVDNALKLIFEPLFYMDTDDRVVPNIAQSYNLSQDGLTLTINLRQDAKWQDGKSITAEDVVFSIDTIKANPLAMYHRTLTNLESYRAVNSSTVVINYSGAYGACMYNLCFPVIPKHYYQGKTGADSDVSLKPMGSGMYKFGGYDIVKKMTLNKCGNFNGTPYIDNIEFIITDNKETDLYSFEQGITDVMTVDVSEWGKFNNTRNAKSSKINTNSFEFVGYNFKNPVFQNINVRKAIACAVPSEEIKDNIYLSNAETSLVPVNPFSWLSCADELTYYEYNIQNAAKFISQSGFTQDALTFNLIVNKENNERCESANLIANCLNQIGMKVSVVQLSFEDYKKALDEDNFDLFVGGAKLSNTPDLRCLLASYSMGEGGINYTNYSDASMDLLLNQACNAVGEDNYKKNMVEIQKYCADQLPFVGILFKDEVILTGEKIHGESSPTAENSLNGIQNWFIGN